MEQSSHVRNRGFLKEGQNTNVTNVLYISDMNSGEHIDTKIPSILEDKIVQTVEGD